MERVRWVTTCSVRRVVQGCRRESKEEKEWEREVRERERVDSRRILVDRETGNERKKERQEGKP